MITWPFYIFISFLIILILTSAVIGPYLQEDYADMATSSSSDHTYMYTNAFLKNKTRAYWPFILSFMMSDSPSNQLKTTACTTTSCKPFIFLPTFLDSVCSLSSTAEQSSNKCTNFFADNISVSDPYFYDSPQVCTTINGSIGTDKKQSMVRILNNNYSFMKRCIQIQITKKETMGTQLQITTSGNMDLFTLLRPCMIMFHGIGMYYLNIFAGQVQPSGSSSSSGPNSPTTLISYSNSATSNKINLTNVTMDNSISTVKVYPVGESIPATNLSTTLPTYATIYYFNYEEPADYFTQAMYDSLTVNTLTLVFDQKYLVTLTTATPLVVTFNTSTSTNYCRSMTFTWSEKKLKIFLTTSVSNGAGFTTNTHLDFTSKLSNISDASAIYHIIVTYTVDLLIITTFVKDLLTGSSKTYVTMQQLAVTDNGSPVYLQYNYKNTNTNYTGNASVCPQTAIPNMALVAKQLGYSLN